ncbi:MAG: hypothetical protein AAF495_17985 [Pseudomonadota bacterium]
MPSAVLGLGAAVFGLVLTTAAAAADLKRYSYQGAPFTDAMAPFAAGQSITGHFIIDCAVAGGASGCRKLPRGDYRDAVTAFRFTAGGITIDQHSAGLRERSFVMVTDANGALRFWQVDLVAAAGLILSDHISSVEDIVCLSAACERQASNFETPGLWEVDAVNPP